MIMKIYLVRLLLLCYSTQGGTGGVSFANKNVSGLQKYLRFQNEYNKVEIELCVVQFWTEIKLVITNRTPASRSCDFVIMRLISVQIALHSVQLPLYIVCHNREKLSIPVRWDKDFIYGQIMQGKIFPITGLARFSYEYNLNFICVN
jgi:hypothetical protein